MALRLHLLIFLSLLISQTLTLPVPNQVSDFSHQDLISRKVAKRLTEIGESGQKRDDFRNNLQKRGLEEKDAESESEKADYFREFEQKWEFFEIERF